MASREFRPPEEKTSPVLFFVVGLLMVAVSLWTVWDEIYTRRPWKNQQIEFNRLESQIVQKQLDKNRLKTGAEVAKVSKKPPKKVTLLALVGTFLPNLRPLGATGA